MKVNRAKVLTALENASVAVTSNAILEQSNTFVFTDGLLITFDGEMCTKQDSPFGIEIEGSIVCDDFLKILQRFPDQDIDVTVKKGEMIIKGKHRSAGIKMMAEILLPYTDIPEPDKFYPLAEHVQEILVQASRVCGKDETAPKTTHVYIAKDRIESTDSFRVFRADIETGVPESVLVHSLSIVNACKSKLKEIAMSEEGWVHFISENGMNISLLCSADEYYEKKMIDDLLSVQGKKVFFPTNLAEILERAEIMDTPSLSIGGWDSQVTITLSENMIKVTSKKEEGWFKESQRVKYSGPEMSFSIHPIFLKELISRTRKVIISENQIKVEVDNIHFTAALESGSGE